MRSWPAPVLPTLPGQGPGLRLHDTATGALQPVAPGPIAGMYVCGITPYDATHLGHAATYLTFDLVGRVLCDNGHEVRYVQNVTDIDDPLLERADRDGMDWRELGNREIELFRGDMTALRILPPSDYVGAVESMQLVIEFVGKLLASGAAYTVDDPDAPDVYFRVGASERFGYVSNLDEATMGSLFAERGGDPDRPGKQHRMDALLWRAARPGEPSWPSPMGPGRPGWHIECAAIALDRLGIEFDIQGGGADLPFPHHEYCAAHAETLHVERHFARRYVHTGMIGLHGEKMSKSRGNLVKVSELLAAGTDPAAIRLALLADHYRTARSWTPELLAAAEHRLRQWRAAVTQSAAPDGNDLITRIRHHLANDLDTPKTLAALDYWAERALTTGGDDPTAGPRVATALDALLGIDLGQRVVGGIEATGRHRPSAVGVVGQSGRRREGPRR